MRLLREHVNEVGTEAALRELGEEQASSNRGRVVYEGEKAGWEGMTEFAAAYLNRYGIVPVHAAAGETANVSSLSQKFTAGGPEDGYTTGDLFTPKDPELPNKLEEAKKLPGLESSEDIGVIMGREVTHLTDEVTAKMDERYGKGQWIIKVYGDDAYAGFGIFFPQRVEALKKEAQAAIWESGRELARYGFQHLRDEGGTVVGIQHQSGAKYEFGSKEYQAEIYGDVRAAADKAEAAAKNEKGPALLDRNGNISGKEFMAQPAFAAVGISDEERARGVTGAEGGKGEGRVHIVTRNGKAEIVPHSTWIKGQWLPVVFESEETRRMAQAAVDAINALPDSEKRGQIYAPDVMRSADGYRVIEANPANHTGSSGYLGDNPFIIDSYVSHILGQEPAHTKFIRELLSSRKKKESRIAPSPFRDRIKGKSMSWLDTGSGGALVKPPKQGKNSSFSEGSLVHAKETLYAPSSVGTAVEVWAQAGEPLTVVRVWANGAVEVRRADGKVSTQFPGRFREWRSVKFISPFRHRKALPWAGQKGSYFADCERDERGHCLPSGEWGRQAGGATATAPRPENRRGEPKGELVATALAKAGAKLAVKAGAKVKAKVDALTGHLPDPVKVPLANTYHALHAVLMAVNDSSRALALEVARGKGLDEQQVEKLSKTLGAIDLVFQGSMMATAAAAMVAAPPLALVAKGASYVPVATMGYLLNESRSKQGIVAVAKAAWKLLKERFPGKVKGAVQFAWGAVRHPATRQGHGHEEGHKSLTGEAVKGHGGQQLPWRPSRQEEAELVATAYAKAGGADEWLAAFAVAFDEVRDVKEAVRMADAVTKGGVPPSPFRNRKKLR